MELHLAPLFKPNAEIAITVIGAEFQCVAIGVAGQSGDSAVGDEPVVWIGHHRVEVVLETECI